MENSNFDIMSRQYIFRTTENETTPEDIKKLNELIVYFKTAADEEISHDLNKLKGKCPSFLNALKGVKQTKPHGGIDVYDHTFNTFEFLDTDKLNQDEKLIVRITMLLHDIAKTQGNDRNHPRGSGEMVRKILVGVDLEESQKQEIIKQVTFHDFLGDISRTDNGSLFKPEQVTQVFQNRRQLELHRVVVLSDVGSIPGLRNKIPHIEKIYSDLLGALVQDQWRYKLVS